MVRCLRSTLIIMKTSLTMKDTRDMTQGNPYKLMIGFAMPILLSQIFQQLYNTADAFIVGKYMSTASLAPVTSSGPLIFLLTSFFIGLAQGAGEERDSAHSSRDSRCPPSYPAVLAGPSGGSTTPASRSAQRSASGWPCRRTCQCR